MAKKNEMDVASLNPDDFVSGGLKSDFRGKIVGATYVAWDYMGTVDPPVLGARLTIEVEGDPKPYVDTWPAGSMEYFVPSEDGRTPAENDDGGVGEGPYAFKVGKRTGLGNNTNFAHLMKTIIDAGAASGSLGPSNLTPSLECLIGLDAHWDRVPQQKRSGMQDRLNEQSGDKPRKTSDVLVVTTVYGYGTRKAKPNGAVKPVAVEEADDETEPDPIDNALQSIVLEAVSIKGTFSRGKLATLVMNAATKVPELNKIKAKLIKRVGEESFLAAGPWTYDAEEGVLSVTDDE